MNKPKLLLGTNNKGKLEELRELLTDIPFHLVSPSDIGVSLKVEETGKTYTTNARIKARAFADASGLLTLADDSGLEVDALGGVPGVLSSRYAGDGATDKERVDYLLGKIKDIPWNLRKARFRCVMAIALPGGQLRMCSGSCRGIIALTPKGTNGFGYDPIFYFTKLEKNMAELSSEIKNRISHRGRASSHARAILMSLMIK
jgi:XTP/dITP diphosphohydrolase